MERELEAKGKEVRALTSSRASGQNARTKKLVAEDELNYTRIEVRAKLMNAQLSKDELYKVHSSSSR